jgi:hypothetical protein
MYTRRAYENLPWARVAQPMGRDGSYYLPGGGNVLACASNRP